MPYATTNPFRRVQKGGKSLLVHKLYDVGTALKTGKEIDPRNDLIIKNPDRGEKREMTEYEIPIFTNVNYAVMFGDRKKWMIYSGQEIRNYMNNVKHIKEIW